MLNELICIAPMNYYDHIVKNKSNRPIHLITEIFKAKYFSNIYLVSRINPIKYFLSFNKCKLIKLSLYYRIVKHKNNEFLFVEHYMPFGFLEKLFIKPIISKISKNQIIVISDPKSAYLFCNSAKLNIFDAYDNWILSPLYKNRNKHLKYIKKGYSIANNYADIIIGNNSNILSIFSNSNKYIVPNASDLKPSLNIKLIDKTNIIGYIGNLHERLDIDLIIFIANKMPNYNFHFYGNNELSKDNFRILFSNNNIVYNKPIPKNEVINYIACFEACIIPHVVNEYTKSQDSMKAYDYLACGKPVIMTAIPPSESISEIAYISYDKINFYENLVKAINENNQELINLRIEYMKANQWEKRSNNIITIIKENLHD